MNTDEMILALIERHGFVLPEGLKWNRHGFWTTYGVDSRDVELTDQQAHDLCACEFARQVKIKGTRMGWHYHDIWMDAMLDGDSTAAIEALYEALEAQQPNAQAEQATEPQR